MLHMDESCLRFKEKITTQYWFSYLHIARKYLNKIKTHPLNINLMISVYDYKALVPSSVV